MNEPDTIAPMETQTSPRPNYRWLWSLLLLAVLVVGGTMKWQKVNHPPSDFPVGKLILIPSGITLKEISALLEDEHVIQSQTAFTIRVRLKGAESHILAGDYLFTSPLDLASVMKRLMGGEHGIERLRVTIPEGTSVAGIGRILKGTFVQFDEEQFVVLAKENEGYLFPDTYFFFSNATSGHVAKTLMETFRKKTNALRGEAIMAEKNWSDIVIMASIIEEEAATAKDRRIISGILWKRLLKGMHLGVDAPFAYDIGKNSATLTTIDLKYDSPYNTYLYGGLPPTPITNPGLDSIDAALHPETSPYYYYLSDKGDTIHYAKTFDEHKVNKERYIR